MGCTSSAPNTLAPTSPTSQVHATVQTELNDISEDSMQLGKRKDASVATTELPVCDTVEEAVMSAAASGVAVAVSAEAMTEAQAAAADRPAGGSAGPEPEILPPIEVHNIDVPETTAENPIVDDKPALETEDKLTRLEEVVEKVVEWHVAGENAAPRTETSTEAAAQGAPSDPQTEEVHQASDDEADEEEAPASPSQSASSRATRWEALADIVAELPPSLTVDPLTGQIYALSK